MISYQPFYETLFRKNVTIYHEGLSANTFHRMKQGKDISTKTLDALCFVLDCEVQDIIKHIKE